MEEFNSADILKKQNRKKRLATLEVGMFEISFVLIIIIVLFGLLNYFNILSLSTLYPNQLAFLPHKKIVQSEKLNSNPTPSSNSPMSYVKLTHQASDAQIASYKISLGTTNLQRVINGQFQFNGVLTGFDNEKIQILDKDGLHNVYYTNASVFEKLTPSTPSTNNNTVGFPIIEKEEFLMDSSFGTIINVTYSSSQSARPTAQEIFIFLKI